MSLEKNDAEGFVLKDAHYLPARLSTFEAPVSHELVLDLQDLFVAVIEARKKSLVLALTATRRID
ncbi:hypothetical protein [Shinella oryzae]|uniref:hypothetical protein n=1 Tax=Shinella oryzae TaxID=2871820 RepID=UPI001FF47FA7|nr:hypothetical protein [Shinella oryzae]